LYVPVVEVVGVVASVLVGVDVAGVAVVGVCGVPVGVVDAVSVTTACCG
jgi:hypothetical protein